MSHTIGAFDSPEDAMLAAAVEHILRGNEDDLRWRTPKIHSETGPGRVYTIGTYVKEPSLWYASYAIDDTEMWVKDFADRDSAIAACEAHEGEI